MPYTLQGPGAMYYNRVLHSAVPHLQQPAERCQQVLPEAGQRPQPGSAALRHDLRKMDSECADSNSRSSAAPHSTLEEGGPHAVPARQSPVVR